MSAQQSFIVPLVAQENTIVSANAEAVVFTKVDSPFYYALSPGGTPVYVDQPRRVCFDSLQKSIYITVPDDLANPHGFLGIEVGAGGADVTIMPGNPRPRIIRLSGSGGAALAADLTTSLVILPEPPAGYYYRLHKLNFLSIGDGAGDAADGVIEIRTTPGSPFDGSADIVLYIGTPPNGLLITEDYNRDDGFPLATYGDPTGLYVSQTTGATVEPAIRFTVWYSLHRLADRPF